MQIKRRRAKAVKIGNIHIGADYPVAIQSMAKTKSADAEKTVLQIKNLEASGCEIVRLAVKDKADAQAIKKIRQRIRLPLVADIHFDWRLAIAAMEAGADKIRLNPGNIYKKEQVQKIASCAKQHEIPIRVGVNSGSLGNRGRGTGYGVQEQTEMMVSSAMDYIKILEKMKFSDIVVSLKASNIPDTIEAYRKIAKLCDYPLHLGVTATGLPYSGALKSAIALGALLLEGIGDTIRVSLTDKPQEEVRAAKAILEAVGLRSFGLEVISCPTCGRCEVDLVKIVRDLENKLSAQISTRPMKLAVMGCVVNGPGEAREADIGVAFGAKDGLLFRKGKPIKKVAVSECVSALLKEARQ